MPYFALRPGQAVVAVAELRPRAELQLLRHLGEIAQRLELVLRRGVGPHDHVVRVVDRRLVQHDEAALRVVGLHLVVDGLGIGHRRLLHHRDQDRARVLGIEVDLLFLERLVRDQRAAEVDLALDLDARGFQRLRVELGQHELLGEVLGADLNGCGWACAGASGERRARRGRDGAATARDGVSIVDSPGRRRRGGEGDCCVIDGAAGVNRRGCRLRAQASASAPIPSAASPRTRPACCRSARRRGRRSSRARRAARAPRRSSSAPC